MYLTRNLEVKLIDFAQFFKIILVKGARQVGKSTLLQHVFPHLKHIVFDPVQDLYNARKDPDLFLDNFPAPIILDEIQFVPELLPALKRRVDSNENKGQYFLTGSQNLSILKTAAESLAGRVGILELESMTPFEMSQNFNPWVLAYLENPENFQQKVTGQLVSNQTLFEQIWRGGFPGLLNLPSHLVADYFNSYLQTYVERDVRLLENIQDLSLFERFLGVTAAYSAQEINYAHIGREIGMTHTTANRWLNLLANSYQWREVWPYHGNTLKRISKKPKGYLMDSGFACYLQRISSSNALAQSPYLGALFETFCVNMIMSSSASSHVKPYFYHWRSSAGAEVDLILDLDGKLYPIEIKCKTSVNKHDARGIRAFKETYPQQKTTTGLVLYAGKEVYRLADDVLALPWNATLETVNSRS